MQVNTFTFLTPRSVRFLLQLLSSTIFLLSLYVPVFSLESSLSVKNFSKNDYGAEFQNWAVDIGPDRFIYTANNAGLLVYDGVNWDFYTAPEINNIRSVKVDQRTGRVYTAGYRELGYWEWDSIGQLNYFSYHEQLKHEYSENEEFWKILIHGDRVIFQSFQGLFTLEHGRFHILRPGGFLNTLTEMDGELFIHILGRGIYRLDQDQIIPYLEGPFFEDKLIRFMLPWRDGTLLLGSASHGLYIYDGREFKQEWPELSSYFEDNTINRALVLGDSTLIIGTILDGIVALDMQGNTLFRLNENNGLQNNTILNLNAGKEGIWLALDRGLSHVCFNANPGYQIHTTNNIGATYTAALYRDLLYLGTNQGLYRKSIHENDQAFSLVPGTQGQVWDCMIYDERLFVSHNEGTFVISGNSIERISEVGGGFSMIRNNYNPNSLIQSTYTNLVYFEKSKGKWKQGHLIENFSNLIRFIELDHLNNLWAGHMRRSIYKLSLNDEQDSVLSSTFYGDESLFGQEYGIHVFKIENRIVFTTGKQLFTYDDLNDTIIPFHQLNNQLGNFSNAHKIVQAPDHHYWFVTPAEVGLFHFHMDEAELVCRYPSELFDNHIIEGYENLVPISPQKAIYCLENGYAILNAGMKAADPGKASMSLVPRLLAVKDKNGISRRLELDKDHYTIPYPENTLVMQYALPEFVSRTHHFRLMVEGLYGDWIESENNAEFEISRIPSGEYVVSVLATNEWEEESSAHQFYIKVLAPWYRSILAWLLYVFALALIIFWVIWVSTKRVKAGERKKREIKEQELTKLRNQNLRADLRFKSRELANSTMSIIKKNEFLIELKETLKNQKYQLGTRYPDKYYEHVNRKIDKNISAGDDWKIFETHVEQAHEFFLQSLMEEYPELTHTDLRLCTYLRMNLSSKEIAPLMRISVRGVENHRYRLRKKMKLDPNTNLTDFIMAFKAT